MKQKILILVLIILLVGLGIYFYGQNNKQALAPAGQQTNGENAEGNGDNTVPSVISQVTPTPTPTPTQTPTPTAKESQGTYSSGDDLEMGSDIQVLQVTYDGSAFSPNTLDIKVGDYVFFKNDSGKNFWPASAPHPEHTDYPAFDAKKAIAPGGTFKFEFTKAGNWKYHDHMNPSATGVVNVTAR